MIFSLRGKYEMMVTMPDFRSVKRSAATLEMDSRGFQDFEIDFFQQKIVFQ